MSDPANPTPGKTPARRFQKRGRDEGTEYRAPTADLTPAQRGAATRAKRKREADALERKNAEQLAQVVNLHIAGMSLAQIGQAIGATADEVDRMLSTDAARYVRSQPALRVYVRNWISDRYTHLLEAVWDEATDKNHPEKLENSQQALRILKEMSSLHGAPAPVQTEVKVEAAPEAVEQMVQALSAQKGLGYDVSVFDTDVMDAVADVVDAEIVHEAVEQTEQALLDAGEMVGETTDNDPEEGF